MKTTSQKKNTGLQAESAQQTNTTAPQVVSTTATAPERKDNRLPIDTEARKRNRSLPTEKVLNLLQTSSPDLFNLAEVVGKWVWVTFQAQPAAEIRQTLAQLGADIRSFRTFPDHHAYARNDVEDLRVWARQQGTDCIVVTTQKDLVKLRLTQLSGHDLYALRVRLHFTSGQEVFDMKLMSVVK